MKINFLNNMKKIYFDHAATTPIDKRVLSVMQPYFSDKFGNASSIHSFGQEARASVDESRRVVADFLNCQPIEVLFTSGGSESDNLAIRGLIEAISNRSNELLPHVITSVFEHHAVLDTIKELEREGKVEATYVKPLSDGIVSVKSIEKSIKPNTVLVSMMYVNNEIGTVQPIREIGKMLERVNRIRHQVSGIRQEKPNTKYAIHNTKKNLPKIFFHTDAVQATEYFNMNTKYLHVDLLTLSAHKIYGPKGVGVLFVKKSTPLKHQVIGGGQEYKMRAGTENVAGIVGMAEAIKQISHFSSHISYLKTMRDRLIDGIEEKISDVHLNGSRELRSPANVNVSFHNAEGESILLNLDALGIAASSGSACTSGSLEPSHVLLAIGRKAEESHGSIRFTLGRDTTKADVDRVLEVLPDIIEKLRKMSPFK